MHALTAVTTATPDAGPARQAFGPAASRSLQHIGRAATVALYDELALYPKPGLVSFVDSGSHADMDATTFMRSLFALRHYFVQIAELGAADAQFADLEQAGIAAERRMLQATAGINTHRGAIFSLGLLCAAAGRLAASGTPCSPMALRRVLQQAWGAALTERCLSAGTSNGQRAARQLGLVSVGAEAARGFPVLFDVAVPALDAALAAGLNLEQARLQTLFHIVAVLDDTNLAHRGGLAGLRFAQHAASEFLAAGGARRPDAIVHAQAIHRSFVERRLSPGGAADVLAAACWVHRVCALSWAERRAAIGQRPMAFGRHKQSAGTVGVRPQPTKPAHITLGDRSMYPSTEGLS